MPDEDMVHFPYNYGENYLYLLEVDPNHIQAFWEITLENIPEQILKKSPDNPALCLKVYYDIPNHSCRAKSAILDLDVQGFINNRFIEFDKPIIRCHAQLGYFDQYSALFIPICCSNSMELAADLPLELNTTETKEQETELTPSLKRKGDVEKGKVLNDQQEKERSHLVRYINKDKIIEYYQTLSEKRVATPEFSPWRAILESMSSEEANKTVLIADTVDIYDLDHSQTEFHFSNLSPKSQ